MMSYMTFLLRATCFRNCVVFNTHASLCRIETVQWTLEILRQDAYIVYSHYSMISELRWVHVFDIRYMPIPLSAVSLHARVLGRTAWTLFVFRGRVGAFGPQRTRSCLI